MSDQTSQADESVLPGEPASSARRPPHHRKWLAAGAVILVASSAALWLRHEIDPRERDYHAVKSEFARIERKIRAHDMSLWLLVEGEPHDKGAGVTEERHRRILRDFETLGHAQTFAMSDVKIEIDGDRASVRYALQRWPQRWRSMPAGGRMEFVRKQGRWVLDDHRFAGDIVGR
jgi:hypothetical protein